MIDGASAVDLFVFTIEITGTNVDFFLYNRSVTVEGKKKRRSKLKDILPILPSHYTLIYMVLLSFRMYHVSGIDIFVKFFTR